MGFTWINFIVEPDGIFGSLPRAYEWVCEIMKVNLNDPIKEGIHKILFECDKCLSGQVAFWGYLILFDSGLSISHIFSTILAVFFAALISKLWEKFLL